MRLGRHSNRFHFKKRGQFQCLADCRISEMKEQNKNAICKTRWTAIGKGKNARDVSEMKNASQEGESSEEECKWRSVLLITGPMHYRSKLVFVAEKLQGWQGSQTLTSFLRMRQRHV